MTELPVKIPTITNVYDTVVQIPVFHEPTGRLHFSNALTMYKLHLYKGWMFHPCVGGVGNGAVVDNAWVDDWLLYKTLGILGNLGASA